MFWRAAMKCNLKKYIHVFVMNNYKHCFVWLDLSGLDVLKWMFQGQLVLRTRCLECECFTERREDFQDISVPVQEDETSSPDSSSESEYIESI